MSRMKDLLEQVQEYARVICSDLDWNEYEISAALQEKFYGKISADSADAVARNIVME